MPVSSHEDQRDLDLESLAFIGVRLARPPCSKDLQARPID